MNHAAANTHRGIADQWSQIRCRWNPEDYASGCSGSTEVVVLDRGQHDLIIKQRESAVDCQPGTRVVGPRCNSEDIDTCIVCECCRLKSTEWVFNGTCTRAGCIGINMGQEVGQCAACIQNPVAVDIFTGIQQPVVIEVFAIVDKCFQRDRRIDAFVDSVVTIHWILQAFTHGRVRSQNSSILVVRNLVLQCRPDVRAKRVV